MQADTPSRAATRDTLSQALAADMPSQAAAVVASMAVEAEAASTVVAAGDMAVVVDTGNLARTIHRNGRHSVPAVSFCNLRHHLGNSHGGLGMGEGTRASCHLTQLLPILYQPGQRPQESRASHILFQQ
jgi:hypothetical protein